MVKTYINPEKASPSFLALSLSLSAAMDFKFRAIDDKASAYLPTPPGITFFIARGLGSSSTAQTHQDMALKTSLALPEEVQRELEKEWIRREIISEEIARKRLVEDEVRRELMLEPKVALLRAGGFTLLSSSPAKSAKLGLEQGLPFMHRLDGKALEEKLAIPFCREVGDFETLSSSSLQSSALRLEQRLPLLRQFDTKTVEDRMGFPLGREVRGFGTAPFQRLPDASAPEVKPVLEISKAKTNFPAKPVGTILSGENGKPLITTPAAGGNPYLLSANLDKKAKPVGTVLTGAKRKAIITMQTAGGDTNLPAASMDKKARKEWTCDLCQISATSKNGLDQHLLGKKHKSMLPKQKQ